ncbi:7547_t:CDS:2 [Funneliformis geosporum]|nr:7547_t:CDS:2 [Funneliformis geosporum]
MNNKNLEQLLNISKFFSIIPSPNIYSVQAYFSTINTSDIFSTTFDTPHKTLPLLVNIDNTAEKIFYLQYSHLTFILIFSNGDSLNSAKNSDMPTTYNKERKYIIIQRSIMSIYPPTASQLISSLYNKLIKSQIKAYDEPNLPLLPNPNVDIEMLDQSSENENKLFNTLESKKYISDDSNIMEFNLNVNNNDCELSSLSSYTIDNEKRC